MPVRVLAAAAAVWLYVPVCLTVAGESTAAAAVTTARKAPERILAEAERILANAQHTEYAHKSKVNDAEGTYALDCSAFATLVLRSAAPAALKAVPLAATYKRPRAVEFHSAFAGAPTDDTAAPWRRIASILGARPGDLIAWRRAEQVAGESTGHVMIVARAAALENGGMARVVVIDATSKPHGDDTRAGGATGVGRGTVWFQIDESGGPVGCRSSPRGKITRVPIAIGRAADEDKN